jgi:hypothetical protein
MLTELHEGWSNGQWVNSERTTWTYDAIGNMLTYLYESWSNGQFVNDWRWTYTYDSHENLTSIWHHLWVNSTWTPTDWDGGMPDPAREYTFGISDSAGNNYFFHNFYNLALTRKLVITGVIAEGRNVPEIYNLSQNYPNPFNPSTTIKYELPKSSEVRLSVYDILGREVSVLVNERRDARVHEVKFDASDLSSGVYFYRLQAGDFTQTKRLLLLK